MFPRTEEDNVVAFSSRSTLPTTPPTYPLSTASSSLTTNHNNNCRLFIFGGNHGRWRTRFYLLICWGGAVDNRSQPMPYTSNNNGNNGHGLDTITNNHILVAALQRLLSFSSLQMSISILASNSNSYTLHRYLPPLLHSHIIIVCFQPLARLDSFFSWSGVTLWPMLTSLMPPSLVCLCLAACCSSSRPHQTLRPFFFHPLHRIAFHPTTRPKKKDYLFIFIFIWCQWFLLLLKKSRRCRSLFVMLTSNNIRNS